MRRIDMQTWPRRQYFEFFNTFDNPLKIIQKHGGTIESRKRWRGAHFVIELPLERFKFGRGAEFATQSIDRGSSPG